MTIDHSVMLREGTELLGGIYRIERQIASGGFGNTYVVPVLALSAWAVVAAGAPSPGAAVCRTAAAGLPATAASTSACASLFSFVPSMTVQKTSEASR